MRPEPHSGQPCCALVPQPLSFRGLVHPQGAPSASFSSLPPSRPRPLESLGEVLGPRKAKLLDDPRDRHLDKVRDDHAAYRRSRDVTLSRFCSLWSSNPAWGSIRANIRTPCAGGVSPFVGRHGGERRYRAMNQKVRTPPGVGLAPRTVTVNELLLKHPWSSQSRSRAGAPVRLSPIRCSFRPPWHSLP